MIGRMDVSIIIINYKTLSLIVNCIRSIIEKTDGISYEIIVVDNNSNDDFSKCLKDKFGDLVKCVPLQENIGFGRANNEGVGIATGRNIFFLNPDTLLINNAVKILSDYLDANPNVGCCGGNLYNGEMQPIHSYSMLLPSIKWELNLLSGGALEKIMWGKNAQFNHTKDFKKVGYICGADMMVKHSVLNEVGAFSKYFFMYYEDTELSYRIHKAGYDIVSVPTAKIQHLVGKSMGGKTFNPRRILYIENSSSIFYILHTKGLKKKVILFLRLFRLWIKHKLYRGKFDHKLYVNCLNIIRDGQIVERFR